MEAVLGAAATDQKNGRFRHALPAIKEDSFWLLHVLKCYCRLNYLMKYRSMFKAERYIYPKPPRITPGGVKEAGFALIWRSATAILCGTILTGPELKN